MAELLSHFLIFIDARINNIFVSFESALDFQEICFISDLCEQKVRIVNIAFFESKNSKQSVFNLFFVVQENVVD